MEDDQNGRRPKWKTTKMEDDQNGRRPKRKTTKMKDDQNERRSKWKTTKTEDNQKEDDQNGRRPKWKTTKMEDDQNGKLPSRNYQCKCVSLASPDLYTIYFSISWILGQDARVGENPKIYRLNWKF